MTDFEDAYHAGGDPKRAGDNAERYTPEGNSPAWMSDTLKDDKGKPLANLANALLGLRADPKFIESLSFDEMARMTLFRGKPIRDTDVSAI